MEHRFTLPFPVSINALLGGGSSQKRFPSKKYKAWLFGCPKLPALGLTNVKLQYNYWFADNRARDCENYVKCVSDYLVKQGVIQDDSWQHIKAMVLIPMGIDKVNPRVEIIICE